MLDKGKRRDKKRGFVHRFLSFILAAAMVLSGIEMMPVTVAGAAGDGDGVSQITVTFSPGFTSTGGYHSGDNVDLVDGEPVAEGSDGSWTAMQSCETISGKNSFTVVLPEVVTEKHKFTRQNYVFTGWKYTGTSYAENALEGYSGLTKDEIYQPGITFTLPSGIEGSELTFVATWREKEYYNVAFRGGNHTTGSMENRVYEAEDGDAVSYRLPANTFEKKGFVFDGWILGDEDGPVGSEVFRRDGGEVKMSDFGSVSGGDTIYLWASWSQIAFHAEFAQPDKTYTYDGKQQKPEVVIYVTVPGTDGTEEKKTLAEYDSYYADPDHLEADFTFEYSDNTEAYVSGRTSQDTDVTGVYAGKAEPTVTIKRNGGLDTSYSEVNKTDDAEDGKIDVLHFDIQPAEVTITAPDISKEFLGDDPFSESDLKDHLLVEGMPAGQLPDAIDGEPDCAAFDPEHAGSLKQEVGTYPITQGTLTGVSAANPNYHITFVEGTYEITPFDLTTEYEEGVTEPGIEYQVQHDMYLYNKTVRQPDITLTLRGVPGEKESYMVSHSPEGIQDDGAQAKKTKLLAGTDYEVTGITQEKLPNGNISAESHTDGTDSVSAGTQTNGQYEITIEGKGCYKGTYHIYWSIQAVPINVNVVDSVYTYDGRAHAVNTEECVEVRAYDADEYTAEPGTKAYEDAEGGYFETSLKDVSTYSITYKDAEGKYVKKAPSYTDAGTYPVDFRIKAGDGYVVVEGTTNIVIKKQDITIRYGDASGTYGEEETMLSDEDICRVTSGALASGDRIVTGYQNSAREGDGVAKAAAGAYTITKDGLDIQNAAGESVMQKNYNVVTEDGTYTINKRIITVTADSLTKTYGDEDPSFTCETGQDGVAGCDRREDVFGLTRDSGEDTGAYDITLEEGAKATNYDITYQKGILTIEPKDIDSDDITVIYDGAMAYTGENVTPSFTIRDERITDQPVAAADSRLTQDTDYGLSGEIKAFDYGTYHVTISGAGNYTGEIFRNWRITGIDGLIDEIFTYDTEEHTIQTTPGGGASVLFAPRAVPENNYEEPADYAALCTADTVPVIVDAGTYKIPYLEKSNGEVVAEDVLTLIIKKAKYGEKIEAGTTVDQGDSSLGYEFKSLLNGIPGFYGVNQIYESEVTGVIDDVTGDSVISGEPDFSDSTLNCVLQNEPGAGNKTKVEFHIISHNYQDIKASLEIEVLEHDWDDGEVTSEPTCTADGEVVYTCSRCNKTAVEVVPATGHIWEDDYTVDVPPTCTEDGSRSVHCAECGQKMEGSEEEIPATGHTHNSYAYFDETYHITVCTTCKQVLSEEHILVRVPKKAATCEEEGNIEYYMCAREGCEALFKDKQGTTPCTQKQVVVAATGHKWSSWKVTLEATSDAKGIKSRTCSLCGEVEDKEYSLTQNTSDTGTSALTKAQKLKNSLAMSAGLKVSQKGKKINVSWGAVKGASKYKVFVQYCGKSYSGKATKTVSGSKTTHVTIKKVNGKAFKRNTNFKVYVAAYKKVNGKLTQAGKTITAHIVGAKNAKYTNARKITIKKSAVSLKTGKTYKIKAKTILVEKKKRQLTNAHAREFRYATSDSAVAGVSSKGKIKAKGKGTCKVYVYSRNGYTKTVKVTVTA